MATTHKITFYPVGNGDTSQIVLANGKRLLFDYCHRRKGEDPECPVIDLKARLREELKEAGRDSFDVVAFTHADTDHISGSTDFFELWHAQKYRGDDRIKIDELWVPAAMLLEEATRDQQSHEFVLLRQEARHRLLEGRGIRVFSHPEALNDWLHPKLKERGLSLFARDQLFVDAGELVPGWTLQQSGVEFFCHSPFIKHCDDGDIIRNEGSLIFNARFEADGYSYDYLAVGDAEWEVLEEIVETTKWHKNDDRLVWDLFNIPHHCSYKALSDEKGEQETAPKPRVLELLHAGKSESYMISSSRPIPDGRTEREQVQPPHVQARKAYESARSVVGGRRFVVTMEYPNATRPEPLTFEIAKGGVTIKRAAPPTASIILSSPPRAG